MFGGSVSVKVFQVIQPVLSQTCDVICRLYDIPREEAFRRAESFVKENSVQWRSASTTIDYENPFCRLPYLYMNVAVHANLVEKAIQQFPDLAESIREKIETGEEFRICALGGGPGSELIGVSNFIAQTPGRDKPAYVDFMLVDRIQPWDESWHALKRGLDASYRAAYGFDRGHWPSIVSRSFLALDVTNVEEFANYPTRFNDVDLFICCYLVSEIKSDTSQFSAVVDWLVHKSKPNSYWLFIDRDEKVVREAIDTVVGSNSALQGLGISHERGKLEDDLTDLGEWYINIEPLPRQRWLAYFSLAKVMGSNSNASYSQ